MNASTIVLLVGSMLLSSCTSFYSWIGVSPSARMNGISFAETPTDPRLCLIIRTHAAMDTWTRYELRMPWIN